MSLNILVIGGSGFVGSQLVPMLTQRGHRVVLVSNHYHHSSFSELIQQWNEEIKNADIVVLLSVINNDTRGASWSQFKAINVDLPLHLNNVINTFSNKRLILFGSDLAVESTDNSYYAQSKRELQQHLMALHKSCATLLILSPVYGERFVKRLSFVDRLPKLIRSLAVAGFGALRPLTHANQIADAIELSARAASTKTQIIQVSDDQDANLIYRAAIRVFDICFAIGTLALFFWLLLFLMICIRLDSPGPALFKQQRIGRHGHVFTCYKFRTMQIGTKNMATHEASATAITSIGKHLRAWKLDELPQIFNILLNQMSLVGPRPSLPSQTLLIEKRSNLGVLKVKPGITGWSQIRNIDMSNPVQISESDAEYCKRRSILLYIKIVLFTFLGKGIGDRVG